MKGVSYELADINTLPLVGRGYDAIWFNSSLHHVRELETVCDRVASALKPGGFVFINEYVGADRFDFSARQKEAIRAAFALVPARYRRSFTGEGHPVQPTPLIPDPREWQQPIRQKPSGPPTF